MNFADRLLDAIDRKGTPAIVGLDPRYDSLPREFRHVAAPNPADAASAILGFCRRVIDVVAPLVPAVKPNIAFFETYGWQGYRAFQETVAHAQEKGLLVIADAKRGDIGSTAEAYAKAVFDEAGADAVTLSPWLGEDSLAPFFEYCTAGKGCFLLVKTSNPSSRDIQDLEHGKGKVFEAVARLVVRWGKPYLGGRGYSAVGAVVGATFPDQAAVLRGAMPQTPFLLPGYGMQGAKVATLGCGFDGRGYGAVVNSSRGILYSFSREPYDAMYGDERWDEAVREATHAMRRDMERTVPDAGWVR